MLKKASGVLKGQGSFRSWNREGMAFQTRGPASPKTAVESELRLEKLTVVKLASEAGPSAGLES